MPGVGKIIQISSHTCKFININCSFFFVFSIIDRLIHRPADEMAAYNAAGGGEIKSLKGQLKLKSEIFMC